MSRFVPRNFGNIAEKFYQVGPPQSRHYSFAILSNPDFSMAISYSRTTVVELGISPVEIARSQMLQSITRKFYLHKSFDLQSDLEFLPSIPADQNFSGIAQAPQMARIPAPSPHQLSSPPMGHNAHFASHGKRDFVPSSGPQHHFNDLLNTPKNTMAFLNSEISPKRPMGSPNGANVNPRRRGNGPEMPVSQRGRGSRH